jgi:hypothetical protein
MEEELATTNSSLPAGRQASGDKKRLSFLSVFCEAKNFLN